MFELHSENIILANLKPSGIDTDKKSTFQKANNAPNGHRRKNSADFLASKTNLKDNQGDWLQDIGPDKGQLVDEILMDQSQARKQKVNEYNRRTTGRFGLVNEED